MYIEQGRYFQSLTIILNTFESTSDNTAVENLTNQGKDFSTTTNT